MVGKSKLMNNSTKTLYSYLILTASSSLSRLSSSARLNSSLMIALLIPTVYNKCYWKDAKGKKHNTIKKKLGRRRKKKILEMESTKKKIQYCRTATSNKLISQLFSMQSFNGRRLRIFLINIPVLLCLELLRKERQDSKT